MIFKTKIILPTIFFSVIPCLFFIHQPTNQAIYKIMTNYNGQSDLLLSLQIFSDYYPHQFKQKHLYDYLTNSTQYIISNQFVSSDKQKIKKSFQKKLNSLFNNVQEFGPSLWNKDLYDSGLVYRNNQFWNTKNTHYLFLEQFIADDYLNLSDGINSLPKHQKLLITNYRAARDPYTIFGKDTFEYFKNVNSKTKTSNTNDNFNKKFYEYYQNYDKIGINSLYRFAKYIDFWNQNMYKDNEINNNTTPSSTISDEFDSIFKLPQTSEKLFDVSEKFDEEIAKQYKENLFSQEEINLLNSWKQNNDSKPPQKSNIWEIEYLKNNSKTVAPVVKNSINLSADVKLVHHPSLEHQKIKGTAPLAEGSQKDLMVYLYQFANILQKISKDKDFDTIFQNDPRKDKISSALQNAKQISQNYKTRTDNIRKYFQSIKVVDSAFDPDNSKFTTTNSKSLAIITYPPNSLGGGSGTIQGISKFPFIYRDIGFNQVFPKNYNHLEDIFSVDDNGWWWNIGNTNMIKNNLDSFREAADSIIFLSTKDDWNILNGGNSPKLNAIFSMLKTEVKSTAKCYDYRKINTNKYPFSFNKYHLWNEGLRSPIAINLLLDNLVEIITKQYVDNLETYKEEYKKAQDWGDYWVNTFI